MESSDAIELRKSVLARQDVLQDYGQMITDVGNENSSRGQSYSAPPGGRNVFRRMTVDRSKTISRTSTRSSRSRPNTLSRSGTTYGTRSELSTAATVFDAYNEDCLYSSTRQGPSPDRIPPPLIDRNSLDTFSLSSLDELDQKAKPADEPVQSDQCKRVYLGACRKLKVVPSSSFLRCLQSRAVRLGHQGLTSLHVKAMCIALVAGTSVTELDLANNNIGKVGLLSVVDMLKDNTLIKILDVSNNNLGSSGAALLATLLTENDTLQVLKASGNRIQERDAGLLADALKKNTGLKHLDISHNEIREEGGARLGKSLGTNSALESLNLSWNHLRSKAVAAIATGIQTNTTLRSLDLAWNGLGIEGAVTLGKALSENNSLEEVSLVACRIGQIALAELFKHLKTNKTLKTLKLSSNPLTRHEASFVVNFLRDHPAMGLETIEIKDVVVSEDFVVLVDSVQTSKKAVKVIHGGVMNGRNAMRRELTIPRTKPKDPMRVLLDFVDSRNMRLLDLFRPLSTQNSTSKRYITRPNFKTAIERSEACVDERQIQRLMDTLDRDCSGEIDFVDLIDSENKCRKLIEERQMSGRSRPETGVKDTDSPSMELQQNILCTEEE